MCDRHRDPLQPDRPDYEPDLDNPEYVQDQFTGGGLDDWEIEKLVGDRDGWWVPAPDQEGQAWPSDLCPPRPDLEWEVEAEEWRTSEPPRIPAEFGQPRCAADRAAASPDGSDEHVSEPPRDYGVYLRSEEWCRRRYKRHWIDEGTCCRCGIRAEQVWEVFRSGWNKGAPFHCHHLTYERSGREDMEDLRTLCCYCHIEVTESAVHQSRMQAEYGERPASWLGRPMPTPEWERLTVEGAPQLWDDAELLERLLRRISEDGPDAGYK